MSVPSHICLDCAWRGATRWACPKCGSLNVYVYEDLVEIERKKLVAWKEWAAS